MMIQIPYEWGQILYLKTDPDQHARQFIGMAFDPQGHQIKLAYGATTSWHSTIEISEEKNHSFIVTEKLTQ